MVRDLDVDNSKDDEFIELYSFLEQLMELFDAYELISEDRVLLHRRVT